MYTQKEERYHKTELLSHKFQHPVFTPMDIVDDTLEGLELYTTSQISILYSPEFAISLMEDYGIDSDQITLFTDGDPMLNKIAEKMGINSANKMEELSLKKWDLTLGNPPYGRSSNLAIEFLNRCKEMSDKIVFVVPKTLRNNLAMKRIDSKLHLIEDKDNADDAFHMELYTCTQTWEVRDEDREPPKKYTKDMIRDDFEFTTPDRADICICAIGRYQIGQVFYPDVDYGHLKDFDERSPNSHHFIKIHSPAALERLASLQAEFIEAASNTVAQSALSKNDLIRIYLGES